jgi:polynucleotide 5'-hydroxyl-kinase GRC3/NOL9
VKDGKGSTVARWIDQANWQAALDDLGQARTILLLGATDTGKTTFLTWLANRLLGQAQPIAIVDADVGQSHLGPPSTIGLSLVTTPFDSLQDLSPMKLYFVGATSPRGHLLPMIVGTKHLVDCARSLEATPVIIDTCGFISADGGQALQRHQIDVVDPDVVVCLQRARECEAVLLAFRYRQRPHILRLRASHACRRRSMEERRQHRERALRTYLGKPQVISLAWGDLNLVEAPLGGDTALDITGHRHLQDVGTPEILWAERQDGELHVVLPSRPCPDAMAKLARTVGMRIRPWFAEELYGTLIGLLDEAGETLGIGILQHLDFARRRLEVLTAEGIEGIRGVHWSRMRMGPSGNLQYIISTTR